MVKSDNIVAVLILYVRVTVAGQCGPVHGRGHPRVVHGRRGRHARDEPAVGRAEVARGARPHIRHTEVRSCPVLSVRRDRPGKWLVLGVSGIYSRL